MASENNDTRKVSEEFVIKVFDKVRDVNEVLSTDVKELRNAVIGLVEAYNKRYEGQPRPKELHVLLDGWGKTFEIRHAASKEKLEYLEGIVTKSSTMLKEHCDHADAGFCSIEEELKEDEGMLNKIYSRLGEVKNRVHIMIAAVLISLAIFSVAYFFVSHSVDKIIREKMVVVEQHYDSDLRKDIQELKELIEEHIKWDKQGRG